MPGFVATVPKIFLQPPFPSTILPSRRAHTADSRPNVVADSHVNRLNSALPDSAMPIATVVQSSTYTDTPTNPAESLKNEVPFLYFPFSLLVNYTLKESCMDGLFVVGDRIRSSHLAGLGRDGDHSGHAVHR